MTQRIIGLALTATASVFLAACAGMPTSSDKLDQARAAYEQVENDPDVARSASGDLRQARDQLRLAEQLAEEGEDLELVEHRAYLAEGYAMIAAERARTSQLQREVSSMERRREQLALEARTQEADRLRRQLEEMEAEQTDRGIVLTLGDVLFDTGEAELRSGGERTVARLADFMDEYPERRVRIEGHTDSVGPAEFNQRLSERRAQAVRNALIDEGISDSRIETRGYGEDHPVASNDTPENRQRNRRVEIIISDEEGNIEGR